MAAETRALANSVVIGAGGMGMAIARRMSLHHKVILADIDADLATRQAQQLCHEGGRAMAVVCDVTCAHSVAALYDTVQREGGFRSLVHVAGLSIAADSFDTILKVNLRGPALVAQALLPLAQAGSSAVMIASMAAHLSPIPADAVPLLHTPLAEDLVERLSTILGADNATPAAAYALSKWGLLAYVRHTVRDWGERGARIVSVSPGLIATPMGEAAYSKSPNKLRMLAQSPLGREGSVLEIADAVEFLTSKRASFISGTDILVDGGLSSVLKAGM